jgi:AcrR family transcriptional regulator
MVKDAVQEGLAAARRTQILEAAATVFAEKGFHPATVRDVARAAGVADGTIYNYFENKPALLLGLFESMSTRARQNIDPASFVGLSQRDFIAAYLTHPLRALEADNFEWFRVIVSEMMVNPELSKRFSAQVLEPMLAGGEMAFGRWAAQNGDSAPRLKLRVRLLSSLILGLLLQRVLGDELLEANWADLPGLLADLLMEGFKQEQL